MMHSCAHDSVGHEKLEQMVHMSTAFLLHRLEHSVGIKGTALNWFESYLSDRFQFNVKSSMQTRVRHSVPQGSVLGPKLFTLYMLHLPSYYEK